MGRPLDQINFGDVAEDGPQLKLTAVLDSGVGAETCWFERQRTTREYDVVADADSNRKGRVQVQEEAPSNVGEARMEVYPSNGSGGSLATEHVKYLQGHVVKTFEGGIYDWRLGVDVADMDSGQAEVEYA